MFHLSGMATVTREHLFQVTARARKQPGALALARETKAR